MTGFVVAFLITSYIATGIIRAYSGPFRFSRDRATEWFGWHTFAWICTMAFVAIILAIVAGVHYALA